MYIWQIYYIHDDLMDTLISQQVVFYPRESMSEAPLLLRVSRVLHPHPLIGLPSQLVRMRLATCPSLHWNVTRIHPNHARLGHWTKRTHVCTSRHSWHTTHRLLHLSWVWSRYRLIPRRYVS